MYQIIALVQNQQKEGSHGVVSDSGQRDRAKADYDARLSHYRRCNGRQYRHRRSPKRLRRVPER